MELMDNLGVRVIAIVLVAVVVMLAYDEIHRRLR